MSQATCQTKEIDRAHRSHSTIEAKQNKTNKKNQGSPINTIKSHDSILVPLLGRPGCIHRRVCTGQASGCFFFYLTTTGWIFYISLLCENSIKSIMCVCVFFPFILDIKFVGRTSRGHTGGRSHRIFHPPSFCGACLNFSREKDSAIPFPRRP